MPKSETETPLYALRPRRSVLYMPASNARALEKATTLPVDSIIFDLEDAVAPNTKDLAREQAIAAVQSGAYGKRERIIRINSPESAWGMADFAAALTAKPDAILIPKVSTPDVLMTLGRQMQALNAPESIRLWIMVETPLAILNIQKIAEVAQNPLSRLSGFVLGTNDLIKETGVQITQGRAELLPWLMQTVAAARAYGITLIDGVYNNLQNAEGFEAECLQARACGFDGKTLIHPQQIETANWIFAPSPAEIENAEKIVALFNLPENQNKGALALDGRMVERLHAEMAERTLALAARIHALQEG